MTKQLVPRHGGPDSFARNRLLQGAVMVACLLHGALLATTFTAPNSSRSAMQDIAIAVHLSPQKVKDADFIAQADQQGAGVLRNIHRMTSPDQQVASVDQQEVAEQLAMQTDTQSQARTASEQVLVTTLSWQKQARNLERQQQARTQVSSSPDMAQQAMIASLEAQYAKRKQEYTHKTNIHTVDSISARADDTALYMTRFTQKVEQLGNKHYPQEARANHWHGEVQLMVILMPNGHIRAIRLLQGSGYGILDEAAKDSVRQAAPFGPFDKKMKDYTELRIIRTWRFSENIDELEIGQ